MAKIKVEGNEYGRLKLNDVELPTLATPISQWPSWWLKYLVPKLDWRKKWMGCWMWEGATDQRGEPRFNYRKLERQHGRIGKRTTGFVKHEMLDQLGVFDTSKLPRRVLKGETLKVPDMHILHLCGNLSCLNPSHFVVCLDTPKQRDAEELRDKYLAPGTYYNGSK